MDAKKTASTFAAHPRSRGEHRRCWSLRSRRPGSSPLARGTPHAFNAPPVTIRLIPARAGNTMTAVTSASADAAHPRSRGEHTQPPIRSSLLSGSSPLARGTQTLPRQTVPPSRLIPARAGNTPLRVVTNEGNSAHPRSRGEHLLESVHLLRRLGSSPLARGTLRKTTDTEALGRLIPARAGNTACD